MYETNYYTLLTLINKVEDSPTGQHNSLSTSHVTSLSNRAVSGVGLDRLVAVTVGSNPA
jgi:hypothetical protein